MPLGKPLSINLLTGPFSTIASEDLTKKRKNEDLENNSSATLLPLRKRHASQWKQTETNTSKFESNVTQPEATSANSDQITVHNDDIQNAQAIISPKGETSPTNSTDNSPLIGNETQKNLNAVPKKNVSSSLSIHSFRNAPLLLITIRALFNFPSIGW